MLQADSNIDHQVCRNWRGRRYAGFEDAGLHGKSTRQRWLADREGYDRDRDMSRVGQLTTPISIADLRQCAPGDG
jgi:hypothetical protein